MHTTRHKDQRSHVERNQKQRFMKKIEPVIKKSVVLLSVNTVGGVWLWQQLTHEKPNQSIFTLVVAVVVVVIVVVVVVVVVIPE